MSFGYSVLGFGSDATHVSAVAAPDSAVIKTANGVTSDNVDHQKYDEEATAWANRAVIPSSVGASSGDPISLTAGANVDRFNMIKTVNGTIATHAWTAVITNTTSGSSAPAQWDGLSSATATSSTSGAFTTPAIDGNTISMNGFDPADAGFITFNYTATNSGGSDAATEIKIYWVAGG